MITQHALENPVYEALAGPQAPIAEVHGTARRFPPAIAPFMR